MTFIQTNRGLLLVMFVGLALSDLALPWGGVQGLDARLIQERDVDNDGEIELILENRFLRLVIKPSLGGVGRSLVYKSKTPGPSGKTGDEMLVSTTTEAGGILQDCVWQQGQRGDWFNASYAYQILENMSGKASVRLWQRRAARSLTHIADGYVSNPSMRRNPTRTGANSSEVNDPM